MAEDVKNRFQLPKIYVYIEKKLVKLVEQFGYRYMIYGISRMFGELIGVLVVNIFKNDEMKWKQLKVSKYDMWLLSTFQQESPVGHLEFKTISWANKQAWLQQVGK